MGSRLQNRLQYVPISRDGEIVHYGPVDRRWPSGDRDAWLRRIEEEGITDVVSFIPPSVEQAWMELMPLRFRKVAGDERWGVFEVAR